MKILLSCATAAALCGSGFAFAAPDIAARVNEGVQHQAYVAKGSYHDHVRFCKALTACHDDPTRPQCEWYLHKPPSGK